MKLELVNCMYAILSEQMELKIILLYLNLTGWELWRKNRVRVLRQSGLVQDEPAPKLEPEVVRLPHRHHRGRVLHEIGRKGKHCANLSTIYYFY